MRKNAIRLIAILAIIAVMVMLQICMFTGAAAPATHTVYVPDGESSFAITLVAAPIGTAPYAGLEFGLTISDGDALKLGSFQRDPSLLGSQLSAGIQDSPYYVRNGIHFFGFFSNHNALRGTVTVGKLSFAGYTGDGDVTVTLVYMQVVRRGADGATFGEENTGDVLVITVKRGSPTDPTSPTGPGDPTDPNSPVGPTDPNNPGEPASPGSGSTVTIFVPDTDVPLESGGPGTDVSGPGGRWHYIDVTDPEAWYYGAVYFVTDYRLMQGTGGSMFSPGAPLTRAMFVTVLGRLAEQRGEVTSGFGNPYKDVPDGMWYSQYVAWAADKGIAHGYSATSFGPDDPLSREQMAALIVRFSDYLGIGLGHSYGIGFSDIGAISEWAVEPIGRAVGAGLMQGANGWFRPRDTSNRAEMAQLFTNFVITCYVQLQS